MAIPLFPTYCSPWVAPCFPITAFGSHLRFIEGPSLTSADPLLAGVLTTVSSSASPFIHSPAVIAYLLPRPVPGKEDRHNPCRPQGTQRPDGERSQFPTLAQCAGGQEGSGVPEVHVGATQTGVKWRASQKRRFPTPSGADEQEGVRQFWKESWRGDEAGEIPMGEGYHWLRVYSLAEFSPLCCRPVCVHSLA